MNIEDLYLELGRAMTEKIQEGQKAKDNEKVFQAELASIQVKQQDARNNARTKQERIQQHIDELQEAIRLASEGIDPCLAKLTAKESLEEQRELKKTLDDITTSMVNANKITANNLYGNLGVANAAQPYMHYPTYKGTTGYQP